MVVEVASKQLKHMAVCCISVGKNEISIVSLF